MVFGFYSLRYDEWLVRPISMISGAFFHVSVDVVDHMRTANELCKSNLPKLYNSMHCVIKRSFTSCKKFGDVTGTELRAISVENDKMILGKRRPRACNKKVCDENRSANASISNSSTRSAEQSTKLNLLTSVLRVQGCTCLTINNCSLSSQDMILVSFLSIPQLFDAQSPLSPHKYRSSQISSIL